MRIDKFLKVTRILKRRTVANEACSGGRVSVNGKEVKPAYQLKTGDVVELRFGNGSLRFCVKELRETARKDQIAEMYEILPSTKFCGANFFAAQTETSRSGNGSALQRAYTGQNRHRRDAPEKYASGAHGDKYRPQIRACPA